MQEEMLRDESLSGPTEPENPPDAQPRRFANRREFIAWSWFRIHQTRRYWLAPVLLVIVVASMVLNLFTGYNVLPAIYSLIP
jgi:hypothetical protein